MERRLCWKNYLSIDMEITKNYDRAYIVIWEKNLQRNEGKWSQGWEITAINSGYCNFFHLSPSYVNFSYSEVEHTFMYLVYLCFLFYELSIHILCLFFCKKIGFCYWFVGVYIKEISPLSWVTVRLSHCCLLTVLMVCFVIQKIWFCYMIEFTSSFLSWFLEFVSKLGRLFFRK